MTPIVHITNYQQGINAGFLTEGIINSIPEHVDQQFKGEPMHVSIAYITVNTTHNAANLRAYNTVLSLSIVGKSYPYTLQHSNIEIYQANKRLILNSYANYEARDADFKTMQAAFETLVFMRVGKITNDLLKAYNIKTA